MRRLYRLSGFLVVLLGLSSCALPPKQESSFREAYYSAHSVVLSRFGQMQGNYISTGTHPTRLVVTPQPSRDVTEALLLWTQGDLKHSADNRQFQLSAFGGTEPSVSGAFAPLTNGQLSTRTCALVWRLVSSNTGPNVLQGRTEPGGCVFQSNGNAVALHKEIAFDGDFITVADRVDGPDTATVTPVITQFARIQSASVRVGRLESGQWRMAVGFTLPTDGQRRSPVDAAGMDLGVGISLRLELIDDQPQWRLVISEKDTGEIIGQAWADLNAQRIGWADAGLQIGVSL